jgi:hypothetical protein
MASTVGPRLVEFLMTHKELATSIGAHKGFFVSRRAEELIKPIAHPEWANEPDLHSLRERVTAEIGKINEYLNQKIGTTAAPGPLGQFREPGSPDPQPQSAEIKVSPNKHLNLADVALTKTDTNEKKAKERRSKLLAGRKRRVRGIVWRAAAIHPDLWMNSGIELNIVAVDEIVDRRLRSVERLTAQISSRPALGQLGIRAAPGTATGPWFDDFRVRPFEYPRVRESVKKVVAAIGATNILEPVPDAKTFQGDKPWVWQEKRHKRLHYNVAPFPGARERDEVHANWKQEAQRPQSYRIKMAPLSPLTPAGVMDMLFEAKLNFWDRNWFFCDHVLSALHVEALLFALRRRNSANPDDEFNNQVFVNPVPGGNQDYIQLGAIVTQRNNDRLMSDKEDRYFQNDLIDASDLQIGDHLVFSNSALHQFMVRDEWRLENAFIVDLASDSKKPGVVRKRLMLQGHGIEPTSYAQYQKDLLGRLTRELKALREMIADHASDVDFRHPITAAVIVRWEPFERFGGPGAWWIGIPVGEEERWQVPADIKLELSKVILKEDVVGSPPNPFPTANVPLALFPVYEPEMKNVPDGSDPWREYLKRRGTNQPGSNVPPPLQPTRVTADVIPGIFLGGQDRFVAIVRPMVRP